MSFRIIETPTRTVSGSKGEDSKITQSLQRGFTLDTDDAGDNQVDAKNALRSFEGVFEGASYPGSQFFYCSNVAVNQVGPISYEATANYASIPYDEDENPEGDPTLERPEISYSSVTTQVETDVDVDGDPIANAAGELYTGVMMDVTDAVIIIKKRYAFFSPAAFSVYRNKVNDNTFMGYPAGRLRVTNLIPQEVRQANKIFWEVTVELTDRQPLTDDVTDDKAWWIRKRNEGFYQLIAPANKRQRCLDENNEPVTAPAPLSAAGVQIDDDATPNFLYFEIYKPIDFSEMNLGVT
jgi:hypothetical protein